MTLIWDNAQNYSNQSPGDTDNNTAGYPGFWFGSRTVPSQIGGAYNNTLKATSQLSQSQPIYNLAVSAGGRITTAGDTAQVIMTIPDSDIKAIVNVSYVGQFSYKFVYPQTPAKIGEFQINNISFVDGQGSTVPSNTTSGTTGLTKAVAAGQTYLYLQLLPNTGSASLKEENPATPGSPVTLSNTTWDYDTAAPDMEITCFLPGVMITTANGPKAVENLPNADLLLTPEHTLYFAGRLVPVRMLVNQRSIFYDRSRLSYDYYHFEVEEHSIVHAANVPTESYLNTGTRQNFQEMSFLNQGNLITLPPNRTWEKDACAPLGVEIAFVLPLYQSLEKRACDLDLPRVVPAPRLTEESDFHLITDKGERLYAIRRIRDRALFLLPEGVSTLRLCSRTSRPCDTIGPFMDDRRQLGVLIGTMELYQNGQTHYLTHHLTDQSAPGWDILEAAPCRWTRGEAVLSLEGIPTRERDMLAIQILAEGPYVDTSPDVIPTITLPRIIATL